MQIPQFLTSEQCLACRGCCYFRDPAGDWSPRLMPEDVACLSPLARAADWRQECDRIVLRRCCDGAHACFFLNQPDHHCRAYDARPFECRLYPFLLSREKAGFKIYAHLSCPGVSDLKRSGAWGASVAAIRTFFEQAQAQSLVELGAASYPDYSQSLDEVEEVFSFDPAHKLWALRERLDKAHKASASALSGRAFVNMFAWKDFFDFRCEEMDGLECVFATDAAGMFMYWPPLGKTMTPECIEACFQQMHDHNRGGSLTRIENVAEAELKNFDPAKFRFELRGHDYIYRRENIAALSGQAYKSRRGDVNAFESRYTCTYRAYEDHDFNACAELFDAWSRERSVKHGDDLYQYMLADNRKVHRLLLSYAGRLGLLGRVVEVDGRVVAYTFGYLQASDVFCVLLEVADVALKGLPSFIFSRLCADEALEGFTWINAMDDFAADDLARTKMSWRPAKLEPFYAVMPKE